MPNWSLERNVITPCKDSDSHSNSLGDGWRGVEFKCRGLGDIGAELRAEFVQVVGKQGRIMAGAGDADVPEAGVKQVRVDAGNHRLGGPYRARTWRQ